ncbi:hypothetical protein CHS0354_031583 [Potamilus streckersoni]|uniref:NACHT domain-containing protein n=1 Tax=Potamilus streckersoni TaxID=2493646 RepID=A0AAE0SGI1_9BIVA|nr:hypothetical protein CHS0354_031583 [Potamilus streckersoni]
MASQGDTLEERLKKTEYKNWLKAGMSLIRVKEGLETFADAESNVLHKDILTKCMPCGQCTQDGVKHKNRQKLCPSCDSFKDEIKKRHKYLSPNWDNTDVQKWTNDHWSVSKCFMNPGQSGNHLASDTDISGLLNFIINYKKFQDTKYGDIQKNAVKVRDDRNHIIHIGRDQLSETDLKSYTNNMLNLLKDEKPDGQLKGIKDVENAKDQIQQILLSSFIIHLEDEYKVRLIALEGQIDLIKSEMQVINGKLQKSEQDFDEIKKGTNIQGQEIEKTADKVLNLMKEYGHLQSMQEKIQEDRRSIQTLKLQVHNTDTLIQDLDDRVEKKFISVMQENVHIKETLDEMKIQLDKVKFRLEQLEAMNTSQQLQIRDHGLQIQDHGKKIEALSERAPKVTDKDMQDMHEDLKSQSKYWSTISLSPLEEKETAPVEEFFTDIIIEHQIEGENSRGKRKQTLSSCKQIFLDKKNQRIILTGPPGSGKSTFCRKIVSAWSKERPNKQFDTMKVIDTFTDNQKTVADKKTDLSGLESSEAIADEDILSEFAFLFYIYSPKISNEETLTEVLYNHCLKRKSYQLSTILEEHPKKILIIFDGMDEMEDSIPPFLSDLLERKLHPRITVLMAMRSWRISNLKLKPVSHYDLLLEIQGFSKDNALKYVQKVIDLNKKHMTMERLSPSPEEMEMMTSFRNVPLLLLYLAHVWCQDQCLPKRRHDLYIKILDCLIKRCLSKKGYKYLNFKKNIFWIDFACKAVALLFLFLEHIWYQDQRLSKRQQDLYIRILDRLGKTGHNNTIALRNEDDMNVKKNKFWDLYLDSTCKAANHFLLQQARGPSIVMFEEDLMNKLGNNAQLKLSAILDCGILSRLDEYSPLEKKVSVTFLHLSIHEYLASKYLVNNEDAFQKFLSSLRTLNDVFKYENLFIFICGLDTKKGHDAFMRICELCNEDPIVQLYRQGKSCNLEIRNLNEMYILCLKEMDIQEFIEITDILVCDNECYKLIIARLRSDCVKSLNLNSIILDPYDFSILTNLTSLTLCNVTISEECSSALCSSIRGFTHLKNLNLKNIKLYDGVLDIRGLTNLTTLTLCGVIMSSECSRSLCHCIRSCTNLDKLELHDIMLHDSVLDLSVSNLTALILCKVTMSEDCCRSLCRCINNCARLQMLDLNAMHLYDGTLDLKSLTKLTSLMLAELNMFKASRSLYSDISGCTNLERLRLAWITLPELDLSRLTNLTSLTMAYVTMADDLSRCLCSSISNCTHLERLELDNITLHDGVLNLRNLTNLTSLILANLSMSEECTKSLCNSISSCTQLERLELITISDGILDLRSLTNLTCLILTDVTMSEECSRSLCSSINRCTHLERLELQFITLHNNVLDFRSLTNLIYLVLEEVTMSEECSRSLCHSISGCTHLEMLQFLGITLHDGIVDLRNLSQLRRLNINKVKMTDQCRETLNLSLNYCQRLKQYSIDSKNQSSQ